LTYDEFLATRLRDLLRFAVVLCGDRMRAEDVVQEVLLRAHQRWDRVGEADSPFAYVRTMIVNENLAWHRKWSRQVPTEDLESVGRRASHPDPGDLIADRDDLVARLNTLPAQQRAAVVLRFFADLPVAAIAADLGCAEGTVRGYLSRALATMRVQLDSDRNLARKDA
jgi:RNA polymerase sigma-70 factor (sigma-E family)